MHGRLVRPEADRRVGLGRRVRRRELERDGHHVRDADRVVGHGDALRDHGVVSGTTAADYIGWSDLTTSQAIGTGNTVSFAIGALTLTLT
jgi:hypothetical protein